MVVDRNRQIAALEQRGGRLSDAFASRDVHRDERAGDAVERSRRNQLGRARQEAKTLVDGFVFREQVTRLPRPLSAAAKPSWEPRQSPSGLTCPQMMKSSRDLSASAIAPRSVFVWGVTAMEPPYSPSDAC